MNQQGASLKDMLALARADGVPEAAKERLRERVMDAAVTCAAVGAGASAAGAGVSLWKSALFGKLLSGVLLLGVGGTAVAVGVHVRQLEVARVTPAVMEPRMSAAMREGAKRAQGHVKAEPHSVAVLAAADVELPESPAPTVHTPPAPVAAAPERSALEQEATLLSEARQQLRAGNIGRAQQALSARRQLASRSLDPEALSLEAKVLRISGDESAAEAKEMELRLRFPGHSLLR